jgi:hypothetical protein
MMADCESELEHVEGGNLACLVGAVGFSILLGTTWIIPYAVQLCL